MARFDRPGKKFVRQPVDPSYISQRCTRCVHFCNPVGSPAYCELNKKGLFIPEIEYSCFKARLRKYDSEGRELFPDKPAEKPNDEISENNKTKEDTADEKSC